jgi:glucose-6-phosphate isomerase
MKSFTQPQQRASWRQLQELTQQTLHSGLHLRDLLQDAQRSTRLTHKAAGLTIDFSHQRVNDTIVESLLKLAQESDITSQIQAMFAGAPINATEHRAVLHVALRGSHQPNPPWGASIASQVQTELARVCDFADRVRQGELQGYNGQVITHVVNLGIGGSDLGPRMCSEALTQLMPSQPVQVHYVSNIDAWALYETLKHLDPAQTAFVVQSKTFTTQETLTLFESAKRWLLDAGCPHTELHRHLIAVTANATLAQSKGFSSEQIFGFWDWVGGRYSVWSAIGLPLAIAVGSEAFKQILQGGFEMDEHFRHAPLQENLPLLLALFGIWNRNFLNANNHHIAAYAWPLLKFTPFLQQMDMESNGKQTHIDGSHVQIGTGPILWGGLGIDGQHAYFQLIHQGQHLVPLDFIGVRESHCPLPMAAEHHRIMLLNLQAQAQALAFGRSEADTAQDMRQQGLSEEQIQQLTPHRSFKGNIPSNTIWMDQLTPHTLGALIALYEHKVFCQAAIWGIHAFDQWGVELGKKIVKDLEQGAH